MKKSTLIILFFLFSIQLFSQPVYQSITTAVGSAASAVINKPAGTVQNDLLIVAITIEKGSTETITPPAGWTLILRTNNTTNAGLATYYKVAGGAEGVSYSFGLSNGSKWCIGATRISNVNTVNPINVSGGGTGSGTSVSAPSVLTTVGNNLVLCYYTNKKNSTYTPNATTTERYDSPNNVGGLPSNMMATFAHNSTGATGAKIATSSDSESWVAQQIAISPQLSPGGVSSSFTGWYKGDAGVTLTSGNVSTWADQSGNSRDATQATATDRPARNTTPTGFNYNPVIVFDGNTDHLAMADHMPGTATGLTAFVVARQTATSGDSYGVLLGGQGTYPGVGGGYGILAANAANTRFAFAVDTYNTNYVLDATNDLSEPTIMTGNFNGSSAGNLQYFNNGTSAGTDNYAGQVGNAGSSFIGSGLAGGQFAFYGDIAEVAIYSVGLSLANTQKVESYLALKYGITQTHNYTNSTGTTIFTTASPYQNNIIGIGRDDKSTLNQRQSHTYDDSVRVYINNNLAATNAANGSSFATDNEFLILGSNTGRLSGQLTEKPASIYSRISREWKVTNTGFTGNFNFDFKLNSISNPGSINGAHLRLLVDDDGDFSNATVYNLGINFANPWVEINNISNTEIPANTTKYFTIGSTNSNSPLPIELFSFESLLCGEQVCVKWSTATEKDNERFEIERTANGEDWTVIGKVPGAINSSTKRSYDFSDKTPLQGVSYYRLKQVDLSGHYSYSDIASVNNVQMQDVVKLFPNPANEDVMVTGVHGKIKVLNAIGADVSDALQMSYLAEGNVHLKTSSLMNGIYYVQIFRASATPVKVFKLFVRH